MKFKSIKFLVLIFVFSFTVLVFKAPVAQASLSITTQTNSSSTETSGVTTSGTYPSNTYSGDPASPANSVVVEIGYGSDEHNWTITANQGRFYDKGDGTWGVQSAGSKTSSGGGAPNGIYSASAPADSYMSGWGWSSSTTS